MKNIWNWQQKDWPDFAYNPDELKELENVFIKQSGISLGITRHLSDSDQQDLIVELIVSEALKTSEIEGEILDRSSLQSSVRREFGLNADGSSSPAEAGIAEMMKDLYTNYNKPLSKESVCNWHKMLMRGRSGLEIGGYRTHKEAMLIVSGRYDNPKIHFEAPPSVDVPKEMEIFLNWFNTTSPNSTNPLSPLARAGIAHLHFVSIHPFEDGNGRIGRAIVEKSLSQNMNYPILMALSTTISDNKRDYYEVLELQNKNNNISNWLEYFSKTIITAQMKTIEQVGFLIKKAKFFDTHKNNINFRQLKVINKLFKEGLRGFEGGLSASNYKTIAKTTTATTTRDLNDLVVKGILIKTGQFKSSRYSLRLPKIKENVFEK